MKKIVGPVWLRKGKTPTYYVTVSGKQKRLCLASEGIERADILRAKLLLTLGVNENAPKNKDDQTCQDVLDVYLTTNVNKPSKLSYERKASYIEVFCQTFGTRAVSQVEAFEIEDWFNSFKTWNETTKYISCKEVSGAFRWLIKRKRVTVNPFSGVDWPKEQIRGEKAVMRKEHMDALYAVAKPWQQKIMTCQRLSGCRPSEVLRLHDSEFDADGRYWRKGKHKELHKGKSRNIPLPHDLVVLSLEQRKLYPGAYLFPGPSGKPLTACRWNKTLQTLKAKAGIPDDVSIFPYQYRHTWTVDALRRSRNPHMVAKCLGHSNLQTLYKYYAHTMTEIEGLFDFVDQLHPPKPVPPPDEQPTSR